MSDEAEPISVAWEFLAGLPPTIRQGTYQTIGGYMTALLHLVDEEPFHVEIIKQRLREALFEGHTYSRVGALIALVAILDFYFDLPAVESPELDAMIEKERGSLQLSAKHHEQAAGD
jgi:hypothetical protein